MEGADVGGRQIVDLVPDLLKVTVDVRKPTGTGRTGRGCISGLDVHSLVLLVLRDIKDLAQSLLEDGGTGENSSLRQSGSR